MQSRLAGVALQLAALATFVAMDTIIRMEEEISIQIR